MAGEWGAKAAQVTAWPESGTAMFTHARLAPVFELKSSRTHCDEAAAAEADDEEEEAEAKVKDRVEVMLSWARASVHWFSARTCPCGFENTAELSSFDEKRDLMAPNMLGAAACDEASCDYAIEAKPSLLIPILPSLRMAPPPKKASPGVVSQIGRAVFGIILLLPMVVVALLCLVLRGLSHVGILAVRTREGISLVLVQSAWRLSLLLCPWVWVTSASQFSVGCKQLTDARAAAPGTAFFVLANHTSFFDTILGVAKLPTSLIYHTRTYMATHLFNLPILSTICISCGHFPVAFSGSKDGDFRVDREAMAVTQARVDEHIKVGGWRAGGRGDGCERDSERERQRGRRGVCVWCV